LELLNKFNLKYSARSGSASVPFAACGKLLEQVGFADHAGNQDQIGQLNDAE
jgi:hypothetical protein